MPEHAYRSSNPPDPYRRDAPPEFAAAVRAFREARLVGANASRRFALGPLLVAMVLGIFVGVVLSAFGALVVTCVTV